MYKFHYVVLLLLQSIPCLANFGLASLDTLLTFTDPRHENSVLREKVLVIGGSGGGRPEGSAKRTTESDICRRLGLYGWQKVICLRGQEMAEVLMEAVRLSVYQCQHQFLYERWNCSLNGYRQQILRNDFRETSFLYAISSAGLVHTVSRACSRGQLDLCTCDDRSYHQQANKDTWKWGGCGDNLRFGRKFTRKFLRRNGSTSSGTALSPKTTKHNMEVGIKAVQKGFKSVCKCHGVSGSCTTKTCWQQLAQFHETGSLLKVKYDSAVMVTENRANENRQLVTKSEDKMRSSVAPRRSQLVYTQESPSFCTRSKFSPGTKSRRCEKNTSCDVLCCGRGYNVEQVTAKQRCNCEVVWCCEVRCDVCTVQREIVTCK